MRKLSKKVSNAISIAKDSIESFVSGQGLSESAKQALLDAVKTIEDSGEYKDFELEKLKQEQKLMCPKCSSEVSQTRTVRSKDNRFVTRYFKCKDCQFTFNAKERSQTQVTLFDNNHTIEDICNKINLEFASKNGGKILTRPNFLEALGYDENSLDKIIETALDGDDFYDLVREVFIQSLDRFELVETRPVQMDEAMWGWMLDSYGLKGLTREEVLAFNIHWPDAKSPYVIDPDNPPVFYIPYTNEDHAIKYLKTNQKEKEAFPKMRVLERKPLKNKKIP